MDGAGRCSGGSRAGPESEVESPQRLLTGPDGVLVKRVVRGGGRAGHVNRDTACRGCARPDWRSPLSGRHAFLGPTLNGGRTRGLRLRGA
jgi:hypothetical protein